MLSSKFRFNWLRAFRGEDFFLNRSFRNNNFLLRLCFLTDHDKISNLYRCFLQSFSSFGQAISGNVFRTGPIRNTYCLWRQCLWTDRMEMCNPYREPAIDLFYQISFHLGKWLQEKNSFRDRPIKKQNTCGDHGYYRIGSKYSIFIEDLWFIWTRVSDDKIFFKSTNQ